MGHLREGGAGRVLQGMGEFLTRWKAMFTRLSMVPLAFLGVGLYRAWIATFFRYGAFPIIGYSDYALFEASIGVVSLACAVLARRTAPLWSNRRALITCGASMTLGAIGLVLVGLVAPNVLGIGGAGVAAGTADVPSGGDALTAARDAGAIGGGLALALVVAKSIFLVAAGGGLGILILIWCEFYGALNPMRVAIYHGAAILFGEVFFWLFMGLEPAFIAVFSVVLPLASLGSARRSITTLPHTERPHDGELTRGAAIPWKPIALMAICTFAMQFATMPGATMVAGNVVGVASACVFVILGALSTSRWFNFDTIYRVAFPLVCATSLLVTPLLGGSNAPQATAFFFDGGYTMMSMFIMIVLANITYRFGISATWLNGIERGIRYLVETLGWGTYALAAGALSTGANQVLHVGVALVVFVAFLAIVLSEKSLAARWGIDLHEGASEVAGRAWGPMRARGGTTRLRRGSFRCACPTCQRSAGCPTARRRSCSSWRGAFRWPRWRRTCSWRVGRSRRTRAASTRSLASTAARSFTR